jgi:hypothetical protein
VLAAIRVGLSADKSHYNKPSGIGQEGPVKQAKIVILNEGNSAYIESISFRFI